MAAGAGFWDRISGYYARKAVPDEAVYARKLALTQRYLREDSVVLEFGCGTGTTALRHAPHVARLEAIDYSPRMIALAEDKRRAQGIDNVRFTCTTLAGVAAASAPYDAVLGLSILHLMPDWRDTIVRVRSLLKPGGVFVSSTACLADDMPWLRPVAALGRGLGLLPRIVFFTSAQLCAALAAAGFELAERWQPGDRAAVFIVARAPG